jgi:hypothetical protein
MGHDMTAFEAHREVQCNIEIMACLAANISISRTKTSAHVHRLKRLWGAAYAVAFRQVAPGQSRPQHMEDAVQHPPIIYPRHLAISPLRIRKVSHNPSGNGSVL